jgi:hypothetical protein
MFVLVKVEGASSVHTVSSRSCQNSIISIWITGKIVFSITTAHVSLQ